MWGCDIIVGIYKITCIPNNKIYIGSSKNIKKRFFNHISSLKHGKHENAYLQHAFNKYGIDNFKFEVIEECLLEELIQREQYWIDKLKSASPEYGFNICPIAGRPGDQNGENNSRATISEDIVIHIKKDLSKGLKIKNIQDKYNVSYQTIINIRNLTAWKNCVPELNEEIIKFVKRRTFKNKSRCVKCNKVIYKKSNRQKYCKDCAKR